MVTSLRKILYQYIKQNDRYNIQNQVEHLQMKYIGTGHADITKWEWGTNMQRDTLASHIGHHSRLAYFAIAENLTMTRMKYNMIMVYQPFFFKQFTQKLDKKDMVRPCGPPTKKEKDDLQKNSVSLQLVQKDNILNHISTIKIF